MQAPVTLTRRFGMPCSRAEFFDSGHREGCDGVEC